MFYTVIKTACFLLCIIQLIFFVHSAEISNKQSISNNAKLTSSTERERREAGDDFVDELEKGNGAQEAGEGFENEMIAKRYVPYEDLEKRLRHFIGKRTNDDESFDKRGGRYFVGKRGGSDDDASEVDKRAGRYFLGKRGDGDDDVDKRSRFFLGKRRYFIGKREGLENELDKRGGRYFLGKRAPRYFLGKRAGDFVEEELNGELYPDLIQGGLKNFVQKRMRYFLGKRDGSDDMDKRHGRYFVGK